MKCYYNMQKLIKIIVYDYTYPYLQDYRKEKKIFGIIIRKAGIYDSVWNTFEREKPDEHSVIINDVLYRKPYVLLMFENDIEKSFEFKSYKLAVEFAEKIANDFGLHNLDIIYKKSLELTNEKDD